MSCAFSKLRAFGVLALCLSTGGSLLAEGPTTEQVLRLPPKQKDALIDHPGAAEAAKCTIKPEKFGSASGYIVRDASGQVLRKLVDTNNDGVLDQFSFYRDGVEVYRDVDSNANKKVDQSRWLNTAGTRWGVDADEDGVIDYWQTISAEEVTAELVAAMRDRDRARFQRLLLSAKDLKTLGLGKEKAEQLAKRVETATAGFSAALASQKTITADTKWISFGGTQPGIVPAGTDDSTADLVVYENVAAMIETGGKSETINVGALVRVKDAWRLVQAPQIADENVADAESRTIFFLGSRPERGEQQVSKPDEKMTKMLADLQNLPDTDYARRAEMLEQLAKTSDTPDMRVQWLRQLAETLSAGVQTGGYKPGIDKLKDLQEQLQADPKDAEMAFFVQYRRMQAERDQALQMPESDFPKIQAKWVEDLEAFIEAARKYPDSADAMLELAVTLELNGDDEKAIQWYEALTKDYPQSPAQKKATGAKARLTSIGRSIPLSGKLLGGGDFNLASLKNKVVLIQYWATWCEPCKADMPLLEKMWGKYKASGFEVVGVCLDNNQADMVAFLKKDDPHWPQLYEPGGLDSRFANDLGIHILPTMILVDKGKVVNRNIRAQELEAELKKLLK